MKTVRNIMLFVLFTQMACVEQFPIDDQNFQNLLVVDAQLKSDLTYQTVKLSRTYPIGTFSGPVETGATVWVEENNTVLPFQEMEPGTYQSQLPFSPQEELNYTLHITLSNGDEYQTSTPVSMLQTPPIDQLIWEYVPERAGIVIYLEASDTPGSSPFFMWEYEETYEFRVPFTSQFEWLGPDNIVNRPIPSPMRSCWNELFSTSVIIGSSDGLIGNKIVKLPLVLKPEGAPEMRTMYSILAKQYKIDNDYYAYLESIKRSSQSTGSLFDPIPGNIPGNIKGSNGKTAIGYFTVLHAQTFRLFIDSHQAYQSGYPIVNFPYYCPVYLMSLDEVNVFFASEGNRLHFQIFSIDYETGTFWVMPAVCTDCTYSFSNIKPDFWP